MTMPAIASVRPRCPAKRGDIALLKIRRSVTSVRLRTTVAYTYQFAIVTGVTKHGAIRMASRLLDSVRVRYDEDYVEAFVATSVNGPALAHALREHGNEFDNPADARAFALPFRTEE